MTREQAIWAAAYAAAFVADVENLRRAGGGIGAGLDHAREVASAERAAMTADAAVERLARHERDEGRWPSPWETP